MDNKRQPPAYMTEHARELLKHVCERKCSVADIKRKPYPEMTVTLRVNTYVMLQHILEEWAHEIVEGGAYFYE